MKIIILLVFQLGIISVYSSDLSYFDDLFKTNNNTEDNLNEDITNEDITNENITNTDILNEGITNNQDIPNKDKTKPKHKIENKIDEEKLIDKIHEEI